MPTVDPAQIQAEWEQRERRIHGEFVREGMRRYPADLEKAYQWAYDRIQQGTYPPSPESLEHKPVPYKGTI